MEQEFSKAVEKFQAGQFKSAEKILLKINKRQAGIPDVLHMLAYISMETDRPKAAIKYLSQVVKSVPHDAGLFNLLGCAYRNEGKEDDAIEAFSKAVSLAPELVDAHFNLANALHKIGRLEEAVVKFRQVAELTPDNAEAHWYLGNALKRLEKLDEAVASYHKVLAIKPDFAEAHMNLGNTLTDLGRLDEAVASLNKAVAIKPDFAEAHMNLGNALTDLGRLDEAVASLNRAVAIKPDFAETHSNLAHAFLKMGRLDEALANFRRALDIDPGLQDVRHHISSICGETTDIAPEIYVRKIFNHYAWRFDDHLTNTLGYKIPSLMRQAVDALSDCPKKFLRVLDLGCGTGMVAESFLDKAGNIDGVDLSPKMLERAEEKDIYANLYLSDVLDFLEGPDLRPAGYDLIVSADTFVYIGKLEGIFAAVRRALSDGGLFVFSVELLEEGDFKLLPSGRYSQSDAYIKKLAMEFVFAILCNDLVTVRTEGGTPLPGRIFVVRAAV
ncbi:MAG: tetratricopeptide repeat protein [Rhodospirillales bacterium]